MYIINSNFTILKQVGDLSDSRIGLLKQTFPEFPEVIKPNNHTLVFKKGGNALVISPDQIVFVANGDVSEVNTEEISNYLRRTNEVLGLSNNGRLILKYEGIDPIFDNAMEKSKEALSSVFESTDIDVQGIGYRFIVEKDSFNGDIHIEPYIKDNQKIFYNITLQSKEIINLDKLNEFIDVIFTYGNDKSKKAAEKIFSLRG